MEWEPIKPEPAPFDLETHINQFTDTRPVEKTAELRSSFANIIGQMSDPFIRHGYVAASAVNRGMAAFSAHLDSIAGFVEESTGLERGGLFEDAAKIYEDNSTYWSKRAEESGAGFIDELIGEAAGGLVPGTTQFVLDVASGLTFSYMDGAYQGYKKGESPFETGMIEAAKTGTLSALFKMMGPLKQYLRAPAMGTVFGIQEAEVAPEGQKAQAFAKGAGIGALYSLTSPGGQLGLNEIMADVKPAAKKFLNPVMNDRGEVGPKNETEPKPLGEEYKGSGIKQRKFLKTLDESADIAPELKPRIEEIKPQEYFSLPNEESFAKAKERVNLDPDAAELFAKSDSAPTAEKGAVIHELIRKYQSERNYDKAIEMVEVFDQQGRAAGQFIQTAAQWSKMLSPEGFIKWANKTLEATRKKYGWSDSLLGRKPEEFKLSREEEKAVLEKYREMDAMPDFDRADATLQLIDMVAKKVPPSVSELIDAYRYQNMLSSPKTHMRNIGYNQLAVFLARPFELGTRAAVDYIKSGVTSKDRTAYMNDIPVYMKTAINSVPNAIMGFKEAMKLGVGSTIEKPDLGIGGKTEFEVARARQIPAGLTMVGRFMEACDKFNTVLIGSAEFAANKKNGMDDAHALQAASDTADRYLLRNKIDPADPSYSYPSKVLADLSAVMMSSRKLPVIGPISKWFVPFLRTPINLGISMIERSPLGLIRSSADNETAARLLAGGIVTGLGAMAAYIGETTWSAPSNDKDKQSFYFSGRRPYSVKLGDKWIPVWYLGLYALAFAIPAAIKYYTVDARGAMQKDAPEKIFDIAEGVAKFIGSQSSTQSIGALFSALDGDIDYKLSSQTGFVLGQMIPGASLVRYVNTMIDPVYRHPYGFIEGIEANLPVLSKSLDARMTPFLEESKRDPVNYFLPYDIGTTDKIGDTLYNLDQFEMMDANGDELDKITERARKAPLSLDKYLEKYSAILSKPKLKVKEMK